MLKPQVYIKENIVLNFLSNACVSKIISDNTFRNPKYIENERAGRSNWNTLSEIETFRYCNESIILPRGYLSNLSEILRKANPSIDDLRLDVCSIYPELKGIKFRSYQERAINETLKRTQGIIVSPTGSGKSLMGLEIIRQRKQKALIVVHTKVLAEQWTKTINERLGLIPGLIGDGKFQIGDEITVGLIQSLAKHSERLNNEFGLILLDEVHHAPAQTYFDFLGKMSAKYRYGLSATMERRDGLEKIIYRAVGSVIISISKNEVESLGSIVPAIVLLMDTGFTPKQTNSWSEYLDTLTNSHERNELIIDLARDAGDCVLILCDRVAHAERLSKMFSSRKIDHVLAHGQLKPDDRATAIEQMKTANITIGTTGLLGEGLDVASWSTLILASPISSETKLLQAIGRILRPLQGKINGTVYDLHDNCGFSGKSRGERLQIYRKHNLIIKKSYRYAKSIAQDKGTTHDKQ